jgi:hypothetical protein
MGPYDGIVSASVDRVGRNMRDTLNTQALLTGQDRIVITADHTGVWDFSEPNEEDNWLPGSGIARCGPCAWSGVRLVRPVVPVRAVPQGGI